MTHPTPNEPLTEAEQVRTDMAVSALGRIMVLADDAIKSVTSTLPVVVGAEIKAELARPRPEPAKVAEDAAEHGGAGPEVFGHWVAHRIAEPVFLPKGAVVPTGENYIVTPLVTLASAQAEIDRLTAEAIRLRASLDAAIGADDALSRAEWAESELDRIVAFAAEKGVPIPRLEAASTAIVNLSKLGDNLARALAAEAALATEVAHQQYTARELAAAVAQVSGLREALAQCVDAMEFYMLPLAMDGGVGECAAVINAKAALEIARQVLAAAAAPALSAAPQGEARPTPTETHHGPMIYDALEDCLACNDQPPPVRGESHHFAQTGEMMGDDVSSHTSQQDATTGGEEGYREAFYEIAAMMKIGARPESPEHIWETVMKPRLVEALERGPRLHGAAAKLQAARDAQWLDPTRSNADRVGNASDVLDRALRSPVDGDL